MNLTRCDSEGIPCVIQSIELDCSDSFLCVAFNGMYIRVPTHILESRKDSYFPSDSAYREVEAHAENYFFYRLRINNIGKEYAGK